MKQPDASDSTFTQTGTGAVQTTLDARTKLQAIYLEDFGAAGSSGSADATAFTNAIAACSAAGGSTVSMLTLNYASNAVFNFGITVASTTLLTTSVSLANGAAAAAGTLTNAPAAGNPTKWIPINDNGTTRYIPAR